MKKIIFSFFYLFILCCDVQQSPELIIKRSAIFHGIEKFSEAEISFTFRKNLYTQKNLHGKFTYTKQIQGSDSTIIDSLTNSGFSQHVNGEAVALADSILGKKAGSLNSVIYFASLPFRFLDDAVIASNLGTERINDEEFDKVEINFSEEGGGADFDDTFIAWFSRDNYRLVYLAYEYHRNGGGMRFRKAKRYQRHAGISFISYENYKPKKAISLHEIGAAFSRGELEHVSDIILENISVK